MQRSASSLLVALLVVLLLALLVASCGGDPGDPDGSIDAPMVDAPRSDAPTVDASGCDRDPTAAGCACDTPGVVMCQGVGGRECCGGTWHEFLDGPCAPDDGGVPSCDETPAALGCPCAEDGAIECRPFYRWRLVCEGGVWAEDFGRICCWPDAR